MPTPSPTDSELRRFVLGTATEAEAEAFSLRLLESALVEKPADLSADAARAGRLAEALADEDDLFDEYVRGELDDDAAQRFENLVLSRPDGRRRAEFARALARRVDATAEHDVTALTPTLADDPALQEPADDDRDSNSDSDTSWWRSLLAGFRAPAARPAWALCFVLLMVSVALAYRLAHLAESAGPADPADVIAEAPMPVVEAPASVDDTETGSDDLAQVARLVSESEKLGRRLEETTRELESLRADLEKTTAAASSTARPMPKVVKMLLATTTRGSQIPTISVPGDARYLEFEIDLAGEPDIASLRVRLLDDGAFQVWGRPSVEPEGEPGLQALRLTVPTEVLRSGAYTLILETPILETSTLETSTLESETADSSWSALEQHEFRIDRG